MKYVLAFLLGCILSYGGRQLPQLLPTSQKAQIATSFPVSEEKPFVVFMCGYNTEKYIEKALQSVAEQEYSNYRIIFIDDASEDASYSLAAAMFKKHKGIKNLLIKNPTNVGAMANIKRGYDLCNDHEILVLLDADDQFSHPYVLKKLNEVYANPNVWLTYGSYVDTPTFAPGKFARPLSKRTLKSGQIRKQPWSTSHLRTCYAALAKKIRLEDLKINGKFLPSTSDLATMIPMIEMAGTHAYFVPECLYQYQTGNPTSDCYIRKHAQSAIAQEIRRKPSYAPLTTLEQFPNRSF